MSLILDALNKADNERKQKQEALPGITTAHDGFEAYRQKPKLKTTWFLFGAAFFIVLLCVVYFLGRSSSVAVNTNSPLLGPQQSANLAIEKPLRPETGAQAGTKPPLGREQTKTSPLNPVVDKAYTRPRTQNRAGASGSPQHTDQLIAQQYAKLELNKQRNLSEGAQKRHDISELYQSSNKAPTQLNKTRKPDTNQSTLEINAAKDSINYYTDIGSVREMSYSIQQKIPTLMYQNHNYKQGGRSTITINGKTVHKGDTIAQGVTVDSIYSDGAILKFQDKTFKISAYSSWVNM